MSDGIIIRPAKKEDLEFLVDTIIEAEKSGTEKIATCGLLSIQETELREILKEILLYNVSDYELSLSGFIVAEFDNRPIGAMVSWIEENSGFSSAMLKANVFIPFIKEEKREEISHILHLLKDFGFRKTPKSVQIEFFYVLNEFRGRRLIARLITHSIKKQMAKQGTIPRVEVVLMKDNISSFNVLQRLGFVTCNEVTITNEEILNIFPSEIKIQMCLEGEALKKLLNE